MPRLPAVIAALILGAATPAGATDDLPISFAPEDNGQIAFTMPSGNIGCLYTPEGGTDTYEPRDGGPELICERIAPEYVTVILGPLEAPEMIVNPAEQGCCGVENIFSYGHVLELGGFTCWSDRTGLACLRLDGAGFTMARAGVELF